MKAAVSVYSFHKYAADHTVGVKDCILKGYQMGASGLDFVPVKLGYEDYLSYAADIRRYCYDVGITPVCFCTGADFLRCEDIKDEIAKVKRNVDIAAAYGCTVLRHDISRGFPEGDERSYDHAIEIVAPAVGEITRYAKELGVITATENHGFFSQDSERVEKLILAVGEQNFGALVDIGNFLCADENPVSAVKRLAPYAVHAHAKDFYIKSTKEESDREGWFKSRGGSYLLGAILGCGQVAVNECIDELRMGGYDGYLSLEFEGAEDPITGVSLGMENLKRYIEK